MHDLTISVNDVIALAKREVGLTPERLHALDVLRNDWFTRKITSSTALSKRLKKIVRQDTINCIIQELVPRAEYERLHARSVERQVAKTLLVMSSST